MKKHTSLFFLYLFLVVGLLSLPNCSDDESIDHCSFDVPELVFSDYCNPSFLDFDNLNQEAATVDDLPNGCFYNNIIRTFSIDAVGAAKIYLHRYRDFPAKVQIEAFGVNCDQSAKTLIDCFESEAIVAIHTIDASKYDQIIIRAFVDQNTAYEPGTRSDDELSFAVFNTSPTYNWANRNTAARVRLDCHGRPSRLILSPSSVSSDVLATAESLGLNYRSCNCDEELIALDVPVGVSLDKLKPKVPKSKVELDTVATSFDVFINIPNTQASAFNLDLNDDNFIVENECLTFIDPQVETTNEQLKVAIVDSGVDHDSHAIFNEYSTSQGSECVNFSALGYDFVNDTPDPIDEVGHGTSVASAFLSNLKINTRLELSHYKFFGQDGGTMFDALCATSTAIKNASHIINCSWGFDYPGLPAALVHVLMKAKENKVVLVVSAGNESKDVFSNFNPKQYYPAAARGFGYDENIMAVASFRQLNDDFIQKAVFSNYNNDLVDVAAIYATKCHSLHGGFSFVAGTSISAPIVSRKLAEVMTDNNLFYNPIDAIFSFKTSKTLTNPAQLPTIYRGRYLPLPTADNDCGNF